jgi:uncharacterized protein (DUF736 family)
MSYDNTNTGVLFKNDRKEKPTHPDYNGSIDVEGREYWLNAWVKEGKTGKKFFSIALKAKDAKPANVSASPAPLDDDNSVPF